MKKGLLFVMLSIFAISNISAQNESFGLKAGFNSLSIKASAQGTSATESASGFYIGLFGEFSLSEKALIQPELQYISVSEDGENSSVLALPVMVKYMVADKFSIQAGPQFEYILDEDAAGLNKFGFGLGAGLSVDLTDELFLDGRYVFGLSNRLEDNNIGGVNVDVKFNYIQVGLGYRL